MKSLVFLKDDAYSVAPKLLGWGFYKVEDSGKYTGGIISETEAYHQSDEASHSHKGKTNRNSVMFGPSGHLYAYFTYGMHWCINIVTGPPGDGQAVLIRSLIPDKNLEIMRLRRKTTDTNLANGPAKICQALNITGKDNGTLLGENFILLPPNGKFKKPNFKASKRIGIKKNLDALWRFTLE